METRGYPVVRTREPGGTKIGDAIRALILDSKNQMMDAKTEFLLYLASRVQHLKEVILPALAEGKMVLCDRFADATYAYQGYGRGLSKREIELIGRFVTGVLPRSDPAARYRCQKRSRQIERDERKSTGSTRKHFSFMKRSEKAISIWPKETRAASG
ncbi:MAG: dTMP kinase [Candidatus Manganitrophus sp.]|nr:dTMP kinase [Candidatus Manganitrophus sp.]